MWVDADWRVDIAFLFLVHVPRSVICFSFFFLLLFFLCVPRYT